jgi:serine protease
MKGKPMMQNNCRPVHFLALLIVVLLTTSVHAADINSIRAVNGRMCSAGELLVKFREGVSPEAADTVHRVLKISEWRQGFNNSYQLVSFTPGRESEMAEAYKKRPEVAYAEPNYYATTCSIPNDEYYPLQWNFPLINLPDAWDISTGEGVVVAVVDTGINPFGRDGFGSLSDDRLMPGYNAIAGTRGGIDFNQHGTHVAGTIGQETNNGTGVAGIAYNATLLPVKSLSFQGGGFYSWIINGIRWATDNGADVINLSLGSGSYSRLLEEAVDYAYERGVTVVAAAGNDGTDEVLYPAALEHCIAVGAVRYDKQLAPYSNYGYEIDLVAPGGDLDVDQNNDGYEDGILQETFWAFGIGWGYWYSTGTSMASPHVAGVAALIKAIHPEYGPDDIRQVLQDTAEDVGAPGWDDRYGYGLVDAHAAVSY